MKPGRWSIGSVLALVLCLTVSRPASMDAQEQTARGGGTGTRWGLYDAVGYGGLGFALGLVAAWDMEGTGLGPPAAALAVVGAATAAGIAGGAVLGRRASRSVASGEPVSGAHRAAVLAGGVLAGGTVGALASIPLINGDGEGTPLGSDERTVALMIGAGLAAGAVFAVSRRQELAGRRITIVPEASTAGGYGIRVRLAR